MAQTQTETMYGKFPLSAPKATEVVRQGLVDIGVGQNEAIRTAQILAGFLEEVEGSTVHRLDVSYARPELRPLDSLVFDFPVDSCAVTQEPPPRATMRFKTDGGITLTTNELNAFGSRVLGIERGEPPAEGILTLLTEGGSLTLLQGNGGLNFSLDF